MTKTCRMCGITFRPRHRLYVTCSPACSKAWEKEYLTEIKRTKYHADPEAAREHQRLKYAKDVERKRAQSRERFARWYAKDPAGVRAKKRAQRSNAASKSLDA
jgi:hypothetical protein